MRDQGKRNVLGVLVDALDYDAAVARVIGAAKAGRAYGVSALAVHGLMTGVQDPRHRHRLNQLDLVTPDGQPVRWALNWLHGTGLRDRVYGPELTLRLCAAAAEEGLPVYLYGSTAAINDRLRANLLARYPGLQVAGAEPSRFRPLTPEERDQAMARIRESGARLVFVGLGCPRQEVFVYECAARLGVPVLAVGAAFDYHSGELSEPPRWMQDAGLQWLFRLAQDPRRLWWRYLLLNPLFVALFLAQLAGLWRPDPADTRPPKAELRYG